MTHLTRDTPNTPGIYCIRHIASDRRYVGSACRLRTRKSDHLSALKRGRHHSGRLQKAWDEYGEDAFCFEVLEFIETRTTLITREQCWIDRYETDTPMRGFNISPTAGNTLGRRHTKEAIEKMRAAKTGLKASPETREKMSKARIGRKMSPENVAKMAERMRGRIFTPETIARMSAARKGEKKSPEIMAKLHEGNRGRKNTPASIAKMKEIHLRRIRSDAEKEARVKSNKMRVWTAESRAKASKKKKGIPLTDEHRAAISRAQRLSGQSEKQKQIWSDPAYITSHQAGQNHRRERERLAKLGA